MMMAGGVAPPHMTTTMAMSTTMAHTNVKMESSPAAVVVADHSTIRATDPRAASMALPPPPTSAVVPPAMKAMDPRKNGATAATPSIHIKSATMTTVSENDEAAAAEDYLGSVKPASQYGLHSHAGDLIEDDVYVSDGSLDSEDEEEEDVGGDDGGTKMEDGNEREGGEKGKKPKLELVITTSKMGLMRRGGISSLIGAPVINRTWVRPGDKQEDNNNGEGGGKQEDGEGAAAEEEDESLLDPAQRLALQQRRIESAKANARIMESSENAGRDPCLFSKRTAFDIRMDQIEEKPWDKVDGGATDPTDYFNYGMTEEDWLEYSERQLAVRQELTDASKQKRLPDPGIVTVVPRAPKVQGERVAVRVKKESDGDEEEEEEEEEVKNEDASDDEEGGLEMGVDLGPLKAVKKKEGVSSGSEDKKVKLEEKDASAPSAIISAALVKHEKIVGGAWGAGAGKDSVLMRLIQEQSGGPPANATRGPPMGGVPPMMGGGPPMMRGGPPMMNMPPPHHMMAPPPPPPKNMMQQRPPPSMSPAKQDQQYGNKNHEGDGNHQFGHDAGGGGGQWKRDRFEGGGNHQFGGDVGGGGGGGQWKQDRFNPNFNRQEGGGGYNNGGSADHQQQQPPQQYAHNDSGRGNFREQQPHQQQQHPNAGRGGSGGSHGRLPFHQQEHQQQQQHRPPPGQYQNRGGRGPPPQQHGRYPQHQQQQGRPQQQQGQWGGGAGRGGGGYHNQRGGPPPNGGGGGPPSGGMGGGPPPNGNNTWDNRKRPRNEFGSGDPRGDQRRGRW